MDPPTVFDPESAIPLELTVQAANTTDNKAQATSRFSAHGEPRHVFTLCIER
jgi:hypothetical protein